MYVSRTLALTLPTPSPQDDVSEDVMRMKGDIATLSDAYRSNLRAAKVCAQQMIERKNREMIA